MYRMRKSAQPNLAGRGYAVLTADVDVDVDFQPCGDGLADVLVDEQQVLHRPGRHVQPPGRELHNV